MADKKIIAVLGATGSQGGGLVRAILSDPNGGFAARAITRDVNSEKAKELAKLGMVAVRTRQPAPPPVRVRGPPAAELAGEQEEPRAHRVVHRSPLHQRRHRCRAGPAPPP